MINTKEQIKIKAVQVMRAIDWKFDTEKEMNPFYTSKEEQLKSHEKFINHPKYQEVTESIKSYWTIGLEFEPEAEIRFSMFLLIDDETGEPFEVNHKQARFHIKKNENGEYYAHPYGESNES